MKTTYLCTKLMLVLAMTVLTFACSSHEDNSITKPEIPVTPDPEPEPEPDTPLHISNGVVTGIDEGVSVVVFPASVKRIQKSAFMHNKEILELTLNEGLETIEEEAFLSSTLTKINFPSTLKEIGTSAFYKCSSLSMADLSRTKITVLPEASFGLSGLQSVILPSTLTDIGLQAFQRTTNLTTVKIPVNVKSIGNEAFRETGATSVLLPNNLSLMKQRAFYLCPNLQEVKTHGTIIQDAKEATMQEDCFKGCPKLTVFEIPQNIRRINQGILTGNAKLESIIIPIHVNFIAFSAFDKTGIKNVIVLPSIPPTVELIGEVAWDAWYGFPDTVTGITVPAGTVEAYKAAAGWKGYASKIQ